MRDWIYRGVAEAGLDTEAAWQIAGKILAKMADETDTLYEVEYAKRRDGNYLSRYDEGYLDALDALEGKLRDEAARE